MTTGSYQLGIDLGTTYTAAAVARDGRVEIAGLGNRAAAIPSVIHLGTDGVTLIGEAADRRGPAEPDRVAREFKRRIGDPTPLLLGGAPQSAEALSAMLLRWVIDKATELEGGPPRRIALTHPANWGPYKQDLLAQAARLADTSVDLTLTEPEAAAIAYAANERIDSGALTAVFDLGGGTFDAAVLRKTAEGFEILGQPEGIERLGGIDFDEAVIGHVRNAIGDALDGLDLDDPATMSGLTRLRRECIDAKEALSSDTDVTIAVLLPGVQTQVRLTRSEFERMVRPTLVATVDAMRRALASAAVEPADVASVLLVGGSSRIPLVAELLSDAFGRPIAVDAHPKHVVARGAAMALASGRHVAAAGAGAAAGAAAAAGDRDGSGERGGPAVVGGGIAAAAAGAAQADDAATPLSSRSVHPAPADRTRQGGDDGRHPVVDRPTGDDDDDPTWTLPVARGGGGLRRMLWVGAVATVLVGVVVASAAARSGALDEPSGEASSPPTVEAIEAPDDPGELQRHDSSGGGTGGATGSGATGSGTTSGGDSGTSTTDNPPPVEGPTDDGTTGDTTGDAVDPEHPDAVEDPDAGSDADGDGTGTTGDLEVPDGNGSTGDKGADAGDADHAGVAAEPLVSSGTATAAAVADGGTDAAAPARAQD